MITAHSLTKRYGTATAVDDLTFEVRPGVVTGFLGPNGSGKSTTMRMIMGLDTPTSGSALIDGKPFSDLAWPLCEVGGLLDAKAFPPARTARNHLRWLALTNNIPPRGPRPGRPDISRQPPGRQVPPRHEPASRHRRNAARRPLRPALRRARQWS